MERHYLFKDKYNDILKFFLILKNWFWNIKFQTNHYLGEFFFFFFCLFALSWAAPAAYGGSQTRGLIGAAAASLHHSHSNTRSELHLQPTPLQHSSQQHWIPNPWARPGIKPATLWFLVSFINHWATTGTPCLLILILIFLYLFIVVSHLLSSP